MMESYIFADYIHLVRSKDGVICVLLKTTNFNVIICRLNTTVVTIKDKLTL